MSASQLSVCSTTSSAPSTSREKKSIVRRRNAVNQSPSGPHGTRRERPPDAEVLAMEAVHLGVDARSHTGALAEVGKAVLPAHRDAKVERSRPGSRHLVKIDRMPLDQEALPAEAALQVVSVGRRQAVVAADLDERAIAHVPEQLHHQLLLSLGVRAAGHTRTERAPPAWPEVAATSGRRWGARFEQGRRRSLAKRRMVVAASACCRLRTPRAQRATPVALLRQILRRKA